MNGRHVIVIGGGFAGASAAHHLGASGARITLLEANRTLGGRARSDRIGDLTIDVGAQLVATSFTHTLRLLGQTAARVPDGMAQAPGRDAIVIDGTPRDIQFGSLRSLLTFAGLGAMEKLRLGRHLLPLIARHRAHLDAGAVHLPASLDRESSARWLETHVSARANELLGETTANAFYAAHAADTSLAFLLTLGKYGSDSHMLAAPGGWSSLLTRAVERCDVRLGVTADGLEVGARDVTVRAADGQSWRADALVIATGVRAAHTLLSRTGLAPAELLAWMDAVPVRPTITLALAVDTPLERERFGIFQLRSDARAVSACASHGAKLPQLAGADDVALAWPTPEYATRLTEASVERIVDEMLPEIERLLPRVHGRITHARVYRFSEGTPLAHPGFGAERARGRALLRRLPPHVALAGDYLAAPLMEGAVLSGEWAAARLRTHARTQ